jgi:CBS domain-containing membrane protein
MYTVADVMTREVVTLNEDDELGLADNIIHLGRIRHLPVVREGKLVGLVSQRDLLRAYAKRGEAFGPTLLAKEVMKTDLLKAAPSTPLRRAFHTMMTKKLGCMPVVDASGKLVGIVTEGDAVAFSVRVIADLDKFEKLATQMAPGAQR